MRSLVIEGYASLLCVDDLAGDVVRAGAFTRTLARSAGGLGVGMLLSHVGGRTAGRWTTIREDGRGLFVRGMISDATMAAATGLKMVADGRLEGLSIGFVAREWSARVVRGREPKEVELREISLVSSPMMPGARLAAAGAAIKSCVMTAS